MSRPSNSRRRSTATKGQTRARTSTRGSNRSRRRTTSRASSRARRSPSRSKNSDSTPSRSSVPVSNTSKGAKGRRAATSRGKHVPCRRSRSLSRPINNAVRQGSTCRHRRSRHTTTSVRQVLSRVTRQTTYRRLRDRQVRRLGSITRGVSCNSVRTNIGVQIGQVTSISRRLIRRCSTVSTPLVDVSHRLRGDLIGRLGKGHENKGRANLVVKQHLSTRTLYQGSKGIFCGGGLPGRVARLTIKLLLSRSNSVYTYSHYDCTETSTVVLCSFYQDLSVPIVICNRSAKCSRTNRAIRLCSCTRFRNFSRSSGCHVVSVTTHKDGQSNTTLHCITRRLSGQPRAIGVLVLMSSKRPTSSKCDNSTTRRSLHNVGRRCRQGKVLFMTTTVNSSGRGVRQVCKSSFLSVSSLGRLPIGLASIIGHRIEMWQVCGAWGSKQLGAITHPFSGGKNFFGVVVDGPYTRFRCRNIACGVNAPVINAPRDRCTKLFNAVARVQSNRSGSASGSAPSVCYYFSPPTLPYRVGELRRIFSRLCSRPGALSSVVLSYIVVTPSVVGPLSGLGGSHRTLAICILRRS